MLLFIAEVEFLGMIAGAEGILVGTDRAEVVNTWLKPNTLAELRSFLGY